MKYIFFIACIFYSNILLAGGWFTKNGEVEFVHVEKGLIFSKIGGQDLRAHDNCNTTESVVIDAQTENGKNQYAALLAAFTSGKKVQVYTSGCYSGWGKQYPKVWGFRIVN